MRLINQSILPTCAILKFSLMIGLILMASTYPGFAQEPSQPKPQEKIEEQELSDLSIEDLMKIKVHSVYGASKFMQKVTEAPASVSIITAEDIKRYGYHTLAAALRSVRGFYINYNYNYSDLGARGFARPGDFNTRVLLLVDGHRIGDNVYSSALFGVEFPVSVDLIDRIEVIRGPSSSLYGTNAFFGVINVVTKRGGDIGGVELSADTASHNTHGARVSYGKQFNSGLDLLVSGSTSVSKGRSQLYFQEFDAPETNNGIAENADGEQFNQFFANVSWRRLSLQTVFGERKKDVPTGIYGTSFNDPGNYTYEQRAYVDLKYERTLSQNVELTTRAYYDRYYYFGDYIYSWEDEEQRQVRVVNRDLARGTWWGAEGSLTSTLLKTHRVTTGIEFRQNLQQLQKNFYEDPFEVFYDDNRDSREWAGYVEDQFRLSRNLLLSAGVRYDHSSVFGGTTNPRFALVYNPLAKTTVKFLYGQAFRAPNVYETRVREEFSPGDPLKPERIRTAEFVVEKYLGDHVRVAGSAFTYGIQKLITNVIVNAETGESNFLNAGKIRSKGVESEMELKLQNGLQGLFSYAYQSSRDVESGEKLTNSPAHMLKLNLNGPLGLKRTSGGLEMQYLSSRKTLQNGTSDGFLVTNVTLLSERVKNSLDVSFSIYNLFDKKYAVPGSSEHRQETIPQNGRTFRFKLTYRFPGK